MGAICGLMCLTAPLTMAEQRHALERVKTGILPAGGFYSIYEVSCPDNRVATVGAPSRRGGPWCASEDGQLRCFRRSADASARACSVGSVVELERDSEDLNQFQ